MRAISLFSGAGGMDLGIEAAGFNVVFSVEIDPLAVATLNTNRSRYFPNLPSLIPLDITQLEPSDVLRAVDTGPEEIDLLVGGPPCVAFSKSGFHLEYKRQGHDPRAGLLEHYVRFIEGIRPRAFIAENVFGLAYQNQSAVPFARFLSRLTGLGYCVSHAVLNAADFGVPQNRQRLFIIGARDGQQLSFPVPSHWGHHERRVKPIHADCLLPHRTAGEALAGLRAEPEVGEVVNGKYGHLLSDIPPGKNYLFYTEHEGHPAPLFRWRSRYWTFLLKLDPNRPSPTIQAQPGPYVGPFHWENRRLRVPELKRLQGFPDDYQLCGNRRQIQLQIGNSVPPRLAQAVAESVMLQLAGGERPEISWPNQPVLPGLREQHITAAAER